MTASSPLLRSLVVWSICVPLALVIGYMMGADFDWSSAMTLGVILFLLVSPLLLRYYHVWLVCTWNMSLVLFFLPGRPTAFLTLSWLGFGIAVLQYILDRRKKILFVPSVSKSLIFLGLVVLITARCTGGIGLKSMGSDVQGGKKYIDVFTAIVSYFALTSQTIPKNKAKLFVGLFFIAAISQAIGELIVWVSPAFYFIFLFFPVSTGGLRTVATGASDVIGRKEGLAPAGMWLYYWMLCRYGIRELFTFNKMGRLILFILIAFIGLMGGFRGTLVMFVLTFCILFYLEGLFRSKLAPILAFLCVSAAALLMPLASHLPLNIQRTLTVIPLVPVDPIVQVSSQASSEWRLRIWRHVIPQVQDHLVLGKGYAFNAEDLATLSLARADSTEGTELVGDYHNGPLSVILPFGIPGVIAFVWFLVAALRVLYNNVHYGDEDYRTINRFLLAYFVSKVIFFFTVFGGMNSDLANFVGILGLSVSLNGGMAKPVVPERPTIVFNRFKLHPSVRPV